MDFLKFLKDYEKEDVTAVASIVESNKEKETAIINEVFKGEYPSKKDAIFNLTTYYVKEKTAPKNVDASYVVENLDKLTSKIENLSEGDIRIIIHNHEDSKADAGIGFEEAKPKAKRGRPKGKKIDPTEVPQNTGVIYDEAPAEEPEEDFEAVKAEFDEKLNAHQAKKDAAKPKDIISDVESGEEHIFAKIFDEEEEETLDDEMKPDKVRWSDLVDKVIDKDAGEEVGDDKDALIDQLESLNLTEEELEQASSMAESGEIVEDGGKVGQGAGIIQKIASCK